MILADTDECYYCPACGSLIDKKKWPKIYFGDHKIMIKDEGKDAIFIVCPFCKTVRGL